MKGLVTPSTLRTGGRVLVTAATVALALLAARWLWIQYEVEPWTRDGHIRADTVQVTPDVSGLVTDVVIHENQTVRAGDTLFIIDRARFALALELAEAVVANRRATWDEAVREAHRYGRLNELAVTRQKQDETSAVASEAEAAYRQAVADRDVAKLNLDRSTVRASVDGVIANFNLQPGDYVTAGRPVFALVDSDSIHVVGYFEETKLPRIHIGDRVRVKIMGERDILWGHVESIAPGIEDRESSAGADLLANVNPTFNWIRLAQRIPVRVRLDGDSGDVRLIVGRTASVEVVPSTTASTALLP